MHIIAFLNNMFQGPDLLLILFIVLLLFGSKKLPELARGMGQAVKEFNKAKDELHRELTSQSSQPTVPVQPAPGQQPIQPAAVAPAAPAPAPVAPAPAVATPASVVSTTQPAAAPDPVLFSAGNSFQPQAPAAQPPAEQTQRAGQA